MYLTDIRRQTLPSTSTSTPTPTTTQSDHSGQQPLMNNHSPSFTPSQTPPLHRPELSTSTSFSSGPSNHTHSSTPPPNVSISFSPDLPSPIRSGTVPPNRHKTNISWAPESYTSPTNSSRHTPEKTSYPRSSPTFGVGGASPSIGRSRAMPFSGNTTPIGTSQPAPWKFPTTTSNPASSPQITRPATAAYPPLSAASPPQMIRPATATQTRPSTTPPPLISRPATAASNTFPTRSTYTPSPRGPSRSKSVSSGPETGGGGDYFGPAPWNAPLN
ncbi:hypothetical protein BCR39DRAFT_587368 [Naematelia encephala]|uniref:Uncharacterized protein n=1 Tax=Naematelia encephala TaxID=71784 RepID=A0A1Y2BAM3_9TREE|nr:hypothetical protein BCR39DRAFT_587368 [Naematelia encephala]